MPEPRRRRVLEPSLAMLRIPTPSPSPVEGSAPDTGRCDCGRPLAAMCPGCITEDYEAYPDGEGSAPGGEVEGSLIPAIVEILGSVLPVDKPAAAHDIVEATNRLAALLRTPPGEGEDRRAAIALRRLVGMMANVYGEEGFEGAPEFVSRAVSYAWEIALGLRQWSRPDGDWTPEEEEIVAIGLAAPVPAREGEITAAEVTEWMQSRPGASWEASIRDVRKAMIGIRVDRTAARLRGEGGGE